MIKITKARIHAIASPEVIERGEDYYESGAVLSLVRRGNQLQAEVQGSDYEPYRVTVVLGPRGSITDFSCTCPYDWGGACKHVVAALLALRHDPQQVEECPPLATLLADLDAGQLRQVLLSLTVRVPAATGAIEAEVAQLRWRPPSQGRAKKDKALRRDGPRTRGANPSTTRRLSRP